jgi:hypothetical protein
MNAKASTGTAGRVASAINYASSLKGKITTALELQDGLNAVKHYERMGLISFSDDKPKDGRVNSGKRPSEKEVDGRRKVALKCMHHLSQGSTIVKQAEDLGMAVSKLRSWMCRYAGYKGKNQLTGK